MSAQCAKRTLIDAVLDAYVDWREEAGAVEAAYRKWWEREPRDRSLAFAAYVEALDREERAAQHYAVAIAEVQRARLF